MADKRINDLPALVTQVGTDVYEMSNNAATLSSKETRSQMLSYMQSNITLQNAYDSGDGTITIENADNTKPFAVGRDETNLLSPYGVYISATRNTQASPTKPWFHFFEALDNSSNNTQFSGIAGQSLDGTSGAVAGSLLLGAAIPSDNQVVPFIACNGLSSQIETFYDVYNFNTTATTGQDIINYDFISNNSVNSPVIYAQLNTHLQDNTTGAEDGLINLKVRENGTLQTYIQMLGGVNTISINRPSIYSAFLNINSQNIVNVGNITTAASPASSAQLQLTSTTKGALLNTLTTAQFAAISSPATGLLAYDTNKLRYTSWNGSSVKDIAYTTDISGQSGTYVAAFSAGTGGNTFTLVKALYTAQSTASGNVVDVILQFTYTATNGSGSVAISLPISTTFTSTGEAALSGGEVYATGSPAIGDGLLIDVDAIATQTTVTATWIVAVASGNKTINLSFSYQIQ